MSKSFKRRALAFLLVLCMIAAMFCGIDTQAFAAQRNSGLRHTVCTALSEQAEDYYSGEYEWDIMSTVPGVNTDSSLAAMSGALYAELQELMSDTMTASVSYKSLTSYWQDTDASAATAELLFYSDALASTSGNVNREHVWPKSRASFYQINGGSDLHHLRPTDGTINSTRSNYTMGDVVSVLSSYSTKAYNGKTVLYYSASADLVEVNDNIKGDVARILLYVYVRWGQPNLCENVASSSLPAFDRDDSANNGLKVIEDLDTLLEWCEEDPVDTWEMSRNDCIEDIQGNRNVFIDYPEYAWLMFGREVPEDMATPSGEGNSEPPAPVEASVSFSAPIAIDSIKTTAGQRITLPDCSAQPEGRTFVGWAESEVTETTAAPKFYAAGTGYTVKGDTTLYALYSRTQEGGSDPSSGAVLVTTEQSDWSGSYVIAASAKTPAMMSDRVNSTYIERDIAQLADGVITNAKSGNIYTLEKVGSYYAIRSSAGAYLKCANVKNITLDGDKTAVTEADTAYLWRVSASSIAHYNSGCGYLQYNASSPRFTTYAASSNQMDVGLYRVGAGVTTYYETLGEVIEPPHTHTYIDTVTAPTCTEQGFTTHTCACGEHYTDSYIAALGHKTRLVNAKSAGCTEDGYTGNEVCTVCVETVKTGTVIKAAGHSFADGVCSVCGESDPNYTPPAAENPFVDVKDGEWYTNAVLWAYYHEPQITNGIDKTHFAPNADCTRAQMVTFLWRAMGCPEAEGVDNPFTDVKDGQWYTDAVLWAVSEGITNGTSAATFSPNAKVSRAQTVTFLYRAAKAAPVKADNPFKDVKAGEWYTDAVLWAVANDITNGTGENTFSPNSVCTRGQIVTFLYRFINR